MPHKVNEPKSERWWEEEFWRVFHGERLVAPEHFGILRNFITEVASRSRTDALKEAAEVAKKFRAHDEVVMAILEKIKENER